VSPGGNHLLSTYLLDRGGPWADVLITLKLPVPSSLGSVVDGNLEEDGGLFGFCASAALRLGGMEPPLRVCSDATMTGVLGMIALAIRSFDCASGC
jgi:hypothetical protein